MRKWFGNLIRWGSAVFLAVVLTVVLGMCAEAAEEKPKVLKIPFPEVAGLTEKAADGTRKGLVVDYLNEIAKYTGWEYEYIDTDGDDMVGEFMEGKYDLMGGTYYSPGFEEYFAYPDYNIGYSKSILMARQEDESIHTYDLRTLNGKTIGVYERALENIRRLRIFLSMHDIECEIKSYTYEELGENGKLYQYLESGEVDLLLGNGFENPPGFKIVTSFDSQPYYIVANIGDQETLDGLNMALEKIADSNPNFGEERYAANFTHEETVDVRLSEAEKSYVQKRGAVTVAVIDRYHPLFCANTPDELHDGIVPDVLKEVTAFTGLHFTYLYADNYMEAIRMVQRGEAEMMGFYIGSEENSATQGLTLTSPYVSINNIVVRNSASNYPDKGLICATVEGRIPPGDIAASEVYNYPTITEALKAVNNGQADFAYGLASRMELDIQHYHFSNLVPVTLVNDRSNISFALGKPADTNLLTILNKAVNSFSTQSRDAILDRNLVSIGLDKFSLLELIYANPVTFIVVFTLFLMLLAVMLLSIYHARMRAVVIQSNLEKAEAESHARGEFLSHMSHELRTPMNAVVGLTDLISMMKDVPADVQENLEKLRASAHYMLDLINDILDMSRINSGRLAIASEPFSLNRMLGEIQAMMDLEAKQRGITYTKEFQITHSSLQGDGIRLRQVLTNLLSNAFKFTDMGGKVLLRVKEEAATDTQATFTFQVIDNGVGITEEDQKRIFETFEQVGTSTSKSQGTGLGLPISSSIVDKMGGVLQVKSQPGQGSEFFFTIAIPLGEDAQDSADIEDKAEKRLEGVSILLAEDNDLNAEIVIRLLEFQGAKICRAVNGRQTLERFAQSQKGEFQLILMDIQMPEMNGLEATRAIRELKRPDAVTIPIVAMTANTFKEDVDAAKMAGMNGFAPKPLDVNYLFHLLRELLRGETSA